MNLEKSPSRSPFVGSEFVFQAGPFVGAMIASRLFAARTPSIVAWAGGVAAARAAMHAALDRPPVRSESTKIWEFQGPSRFLCVSLKTIRSWRVFG